MAANLNTEAAAPGKLLLVDDEENILRSLRRVLRRGDWQIETAADGEAGLRIFERFQPGVVISDFRMPGMNGVDFLARVKEMAPHVQRIMLTGQADQQAIEEAINRSEVFRFISKPWNDSQLLLTVKSAFEQHHLVSDNQRLHDLTHQQNTELRQLNADLELRVQQRTQMLSRAKREWELSFDTIDSPLAVVSTDDLVIRRANRASAKVSSRDVLSLSKGLKCHEYLFDRPTQCPGCPVGPTLRAPASLEIAHGQRTYVAHVYPMDDEPIAVCHYRDVTDERALTKRMIESEKMIAIGNLAGGVAHEINNPLGGILAFSQLMKRDAGRTPQDLEALDLIEESAMRCKRIVESLLKFSRRTPGSERSPVVLNDVLGSTLFLVEHQYQLKNVEIVRDIEAALWPVKANANQLSQVMLNLLTNAYAAMPKGGRIHVRTWNDAEKGQVHLSVKDSGAGISRKHLQKIFEPFFTTKGDGTGLGLTVTFDIVQSHGGNIQVHSEEGQGAEFIVSLPAMGGRLLEVA